MKAKGFAPGVWGVLFVLFGALHGTVGNAKDAPGMPLTLEEAVQKALSRHPQIKAVMYQIEGEDAGLKGARAPLYPQLHLAEKFNRTNNPMWAFGTRLNQERITREDFDPDRLNDPDAINNFNTSFSVSWQLFTGGRTRAGIEQAEQRQQLALVLLQKTRQEVIAHTAKAYMGLVLARENLDVMGQALDTARSHVAFIDSRYRGGFVVKSDLLRARVRVAELEQKHLNAQSQVAVAQAALNAAMGNADNPSIRTTPPFKRSFEKDAPLEVWLEKALSSHPDLGRLDLMRKIAEKEIQKAKAGHWPSLHLVGSYDLNTEDFGDMGDSYAVGAMARLELFGGGRTKAGILAATAALKRVEALKKAMRLKIALQTRQAYYDAQSARKRIEVAQSALEQAEEGLRIVENRYRNGMLTLVSLLDAETARREAQLLHFKALHDYKVAQIDLALAVGIIDSEWVK